MPCYFMPIKGMNKIGISAATFISLWIKYEKKRLKGEKSMIDVFSMIGRY